MYIRNTFTKKTFFVTVSVLILFARFSLTLLRTRKEAVNCGSRRRKARTKFYRSLSKNDNSVKKMLFAVDNFHLKGSDMEGRHSYNCVNK